MVVGESELDALFKPLDTELDVARLARVKTAARALAQPVLDPAGLVAQPVGGPIADAIAPFQTIDLPLDIVDARAEFANLAPVPLEPVAISRRRHRRWRVILRGGGASGDQRRSGCGEGKKHLAHHGSPLLSTGLMRELVPQFA